MPDLTLLIVVPLVTGLIGWVTNWSAVKMIFHPERFFGIRPFGWQAIIVKQSDKFATGVADMVTENLISTRELVERLDPDELEQMFADTIDAETRLMCAEVAERVAPGSWDKLAEPVREMIIGQVKTETRKLSREIFDKLQGLSDELLDLHQLVRDQLSGDNVTRLSRLTKKIGQAEFKFIEYYGGIFGLIIGVAQVFVWEAMQIWWIMPIVGAVVGLVTNWLAIQMIFRPQEPKKYFGLFTYQGLFAKRQADIARDYGEVAAAEILTPRNALRLVTESEAGERIAKLVTEMVAERIDERREAMGLVSLPLEGEDGGGATKPPVEITDAHIAEIQELLIQRFTEQAPTVQPEIEEYLERKLDVGQTVESRLAALPKADFERILRGIFEEDELTLIIVGGVLGGAVGWLQGLLVLSL